MLFVCPIATKIPHAIAHKWVPRDSKKRPLVCPKCKRIDWGERKGMIEFIN